MNQQGTVVERLQRRSRAGELGPLTAILELTHSCNLRCRHCYLEHRDRGGELSTRQWLSAIDQATDMDVFFAGFTGGEILMRPDFLEIARYANQRGIFFHLQTNGTLIDEQMAAAIRDLQPTRVDISVYGSTAATHEKITGARGSFKKALTAIEILRRLGINVCVKSTVMEANKDEIPAIRKLVDSMGAWFAADPVVMPGVFGSQQPLSYRLSETDYRDYMIAEGWGKTPGKELEVLRDAATRPDHRVLCAAGKKRFAISPGGDVMPCVIWRYSCGNLQSQDLASIWNGEKMKEIRLTRFEDLHGCDGCEKYESCVRCAGLAYMETGDFKECPKESRRMSSILMGIKRANSEEAG